LLSPEEPVTLVGGIGDVAEHLGERHTAQGREA
jgi:hypothetical protein